MTFRGVEPRPEGPNAQAPPLSATFRGKNLKARFNPISRKIISSFFAIIRMPKILTGITNKNHNEKYIARISGVPAPMTKGT